MMMPFQATLIEIVIMGHFIEHHRESDGYDHHGPEVVPYCSRNDTHPIEEHQEAKYRDKQCECHIYCYVCLLDVDTILKKCLLSKLSCARATRYLYVAFL